MDALILSAGIGERLFPLTKNTPTALLDLGNGETIVENQLVTLSMCPEIEKVWLVGGYLVEQIEAKLAHWDGLPAEIVYNPFYDRTNNLISLWLGLLAVPARGVITINGDNLFQPEVVRSLLDAPGAYDACSVVHRPSRDLRDSDMKVVLDGDRVLEVSQEVPADRASGTAIGMIRWQEKGLRLFRRTLDAMVREKRSFDWCYFAAVQELIEQGFPVHAVECDEHAWAEADYHHDLQDVRELVATDTFLQGVAPPRG